MRLDFTLQGVEAFERHMDELARRATPTAAQSLMKSAERVMTRSKSEFCPIDTGALRASGTVTSSISGTNVEVKLTYGGAAAPYAVFVHEINKNYRGGKSWKFLSIPLQEALPDIINGLRDDYNDMLSR